MFAVKDVLISDDVAEARFACNVAMCYGACCVQGDSGAPLEKEEIAELERLLPRVRKWLRPEAMRVIERDGVWELNANGDPATTCVDGNECVFVYYAGEIAKCAIQRLEIEEGTDFAKPVSCHLYPVRVEKHGSQEVINYEQLDICAAGRKEGAESDLDLATFLREPLTRKFGREWYKDFCLAVDQRRPQL